MDLKSITKATAKTLMSYLTYQAMRTVVDQLRETDPPTAHWLASFSSTGKLQDGEAYLGELLQERQELALRIMTVREYIAGEIVDFLPEMARMGIAQANVEHRRKHLERITQLSFSEPSSEESTDQAAE
ncbi:RuBisCO chaperone RbcX [Leptolyngbya sp. FACHB-261]|uniref:RuBisCO chaperone RbcX n=1 Tax=Leptolyngbya sp. FACHB-261 TaxID=2692806 RepID=UPI00168652A8|nr:chaperonin family protein RbcX [Leptolyngbya sp. FACHB-261]MBD2103489.1 chaperonin family protein RbcX [Leptolyngbya sp. FACHB-261]